MFRNEIGKVFQIFERGGLVNVDRVAHDRALGFGRSDLRVYFVSVLRIDFVFGIFVGDCLPAPDKQAEVFFVGRIELHGILYDHVGPKLKYVGIIGDIVHMRSKAAGGSHIDLKP